MKTLTNRIKHIGLLLFLGSTVSAAAASPAAAQVTIAGIDPHPTTQVSPKLFDGGSAYWTVRVDGTNFSPNNDVYIQVKDKATGNIVLTDIVQTTPPICLFGCCFGGGTFSFVGHPNKTTSQCHPGREVRAYDYGMGAWIAPITVGCQ